MDRQPQGWLLDNPPPLDDVVTQAQRVTTEAYVGKQSLMLEMLPKNSLLRPWPWSAPTWPSPVPR